jgi:2-keto-3-deoxy-6-phosphogluconate aldolase
MNVTFDRRKPTGPNSRFKTIDNGERRNLMQEITTLLEKTLVVPLVQSDDPRIAVETSRALAAGGLAVVEVVLRTDQALECLQAIAVEVP